MRIYDGTWFSYGNNNPPTVDLYQNVTFSVDTERKISNTNLEFRYKNYGTADLLSSSGTTLTDLPLTQSKTSYAFYQTARAKCFDIPATKEIWIKFDVYTTLANRWRAYNENSNGICGICSQTSGQFDFWVNGTREKYFSNKVKNQLQTVLLHMVSDSSAGIVEAWLDGEKLYTYTGSVNNGEDFADIYLQSDDAGTFFSNVIISNTEIELTDNIAPVGFKYTWSFDTERIVNNTIRGAKETVVYLHFDDTNDPFFDACGNKWNALDSEDLPADIEYYAEYEIVTGKFGNGYFFRNDIHIQIDKPIKLGGKDFTIDFWYDFWYVQDSDFGIFEILSADTNTPLISLYYSGYDWNEDDEDTAPTLTLKIRDSNGDTTEHQFFIPYGGWHHYAYVYDTNEQKAVLYLDGVAVVTIDTEITENDCTIIIGKVGERTDHFYGVMDEFRIVDGLALWKNDFTPPANQINFFRINTDFDIQRDVRKTLSLDFDIERKLIESGADSWYYENFGNASLLAPEATNVEGVTVPDLSSDISRTGSAYWVPAGLLRNMFGLQPTKEIWAKFDAYFTSGRIYAYELGQLGSSYRYYGFRITGTSTSSEENNNGVSAYLLSGSSTATDSFSKRTPIGFHSFLIHLLSDAENGKIELWIDDETEPVLAFTGNVNNGGNFSNFNISAENEGALVSNLIISGSKLSITDNVQFIGYSYVRDIDVERVLSNDGFFARVINATRVLLTFDKDSAPFEDSEGNYWTAYGNPTISADNAKFGKALQLDDESYLQMDNKIVLGGQDFTIDGWFLSKGENGIYNFICRLYGDEYTSDIGTSHYDIYLSISYADILDFFVRLPNNTGTSTKSSGASQEVRNITRNEWHYFAICFNHSAQKITFALDGKVYAHDVHSVDEAMSYTVCIGGYSNVHNSESSFSGKVDEFRILKGIALYSHDFTPPTKSAWAKIVDENFDVIRQIPNELIITPTEDFLPIEKQETDGTQSIEIAIQEQQLTDQLTYATINNVDIEQAVTGQYLDYLFDMRVEETNSYGILTTCKCCSDIDKILYSTLDYSIEADFTFIQVNLKSKTMHISNFPYVPPPEEENEVTEIEKATALQHINEIASALGKTVTSYFDNFVSDLDIEQKNVTYADVINSLFGWTSRLPQMLINCYIRNGTLYVVQRGHEPNIINLTGTKYTMPRINKKIVRTTWGSSADTSYTLNKHYLGWYVYFPPPDKSEDGKTKYTYRRIEPHGYLLTKSETEETEIINGTEQEVITEVAYEYTIQPPYELKTETTKKHIKGSEYILDQSKIVHEQLTPSQRITRRFDEDGEQTGSVVGSHVAGFYDERTTIEPEHTDSESITIQGNPLIDTSFPVYGNDTLAKISSAIRWLNRKTQETVSLDLYDYPHVVDFLDKIIFNGNEYFLQSNIVSKTPRIVNKQSLTKEDKNVFIICKVFRKPRHSRR